MGDAARQHENEPEVIDTEGVLIDESTAPINDNNENTGYAEVIDMKDFSERKEAEKALREEEKLAEEMQEAGTIAMTVAAKISKIMENPTIREYIRKAAETADDVCQSTISKAWDKMPDSVKWGIMYYPSTGMPDPYIQSLQVLAKCGMLEMPHDFKEGDYISSSAKLAAQVAKYGKHIYPELQVADKIVELANKVSWLMDESFYKHIRYMVREKRGKEGTMAANDNSEAPIAEQESVAAEPVVSEPAASEQTATEKVYEVPEEFKDIN